MDSLTCSRTHLSPHSLTHSFTICPNDEDLYIYIYIYIYIHTNNNPTPHESIHHLDLSSKKEGSESERKKRDQKTGDSWLLSLAVMN